MGNGEEEEEEVERNWRRYTFATRMACSLFFHPLLVYKKKKKCMITVSKERKEKSVAEPSAYSETLFPGFLHFPELLPLQTFSLLMFSKTAFVSSLLFTTRNR